MPAKDAFPSGSTFCKRNRYGLWVITIHPVGAANSSSHLGIAERINLGSYYTPEKYVLLLGQWLRQCSIDASALIADLSCGAGAFFQLRQLFPDNTFIGNDIDGTALQLAQSSYPFIRAYNHNCFSEIKRSCYDIPLDAPLIIVGNPPYNDTTSQISRRLKGGDLAVDPSIRTRDLGLSALLAYGLLKPQYVALLHPLSYLVKEANFRCAGKFFRDYSLKKHIVFSSREFSYTSRSGAFPVVAALYERSVGAGVSYEQIRSTVFTTVEGDTFRIGDRDYVGGYLRKYPHAGRFSPELLFYTMRDVNALRRNRTFLLRRSSGAVDISPEQLPLYCYVDCFKALARVPYWMGNLDIPFIAQSFHQVADICVAFSRHRHPAIFGINPPPDAASMRRLEGYLSQVISFCAV